MTSIVAARENSQLYVTEHQRHAGVTFETKSDIPKKTVSSGCSFFMVMSKSSRASWLVVDPQKLRKSVDTDSNATEDRD